MSYDIRLIDHETGKTVEFDQPHELRGGTYMMGGTREAWLNVTYNYVNFYRDTLDSEKGIRSLYGKTGREAIPALQAAIARLGTERDRDYWNATPGNAGAALADLLLLVEMAPPDAVLDGD
ncbi:MAG: hypothetical protein RLZZ403_1841 [Pseudomonadota bacterium]|jgi:hypothetical protein